MCLTPVSESATPECSIPQDKHKGKRSEESKKKWRNKVKKITELLTVMDKMQAPGGLPFSNAQDISACEDLLEAYFMQVQLFFSKHTTKLCLSASTQKHLRIRLRQYVTQTSAALSTPCYATLQATYGRPMILLPGFLSSGIGGVHVTIICLSTAVNYACGMYVHQDFLLQMS